MMGSLPILMCDSDLGCDDYMTDYYEMCASNWRELMPKGWTCDPYRDRDAALCPVHSEATTEPDVTS